MDSKIAKSIIDNLAPRWGEAPKGTTCLKCGSLNIERSFIMLGGPYSGSVRCEDCQHQESVMSYIAQTCIHVEPLDK